MKKGSPFVAGVPAGDLRLPAQLQVLLLQAGGGDVDIVARLPDQLCTGRAVTGLLEHPLQACSSEADAHTLGRQAEAELECGKGCG